MDYKRLFIRLVNDWKNNEYSNHNLADEWNNKFPDFPDNTKKSHLDRYLKEIIIKTLKNKKDYIILNPCCVFGRHARILGENLPESQIIGTDIRSYFNFIYEKIPNTLRIKTPKNYKFIQDDIFNPKLSINPDVIVFFGACGSLTDAAMDYGIKTKSKYLIFRTCCHDNICGNIKINKKSSNINRLYRIKNLMYSIHKHHNTGSYFSEKYQLKDYPRSKIGKKLISKKEYLTLIQDSMNNPLFNTIIDLDRCLYLNEKGYNTLYRDRLFFLERC